MNLKTNLLALGVAFAVSVNAGSVSGPVTGGERGAPFAAVDVADHGYATAEYFLEGEATAYELVEGSHSEDGQWNTRPGADKAAYRTRLLVVRPKDAAAFNGTVIVFWLNVTAGFELGSASSEALRGYAWVGVSAQKVGIDGFTENPAGLKAWDPMRYGSLVHPGDAYSYDIFTQAARAVGPERDRQGVDAMDAPQSRSGVSLPLHAGSASGPATPTLHGPIAAGRCAPSGRCPCKDSPSNG